MKNTLRAISNHKYSNILENIGKSDITYDINFYIFRKLINQLGGVRDIVLRKELKYYPKIKFFRGKQTSITD